MEYTPIPLCSQTFVLHEKAAAALSRAETELARAEERVLLSPNSKAVLKALSRYEALMSSRVVYGCKINMLSMLRLEAAQKTYPVYNKTNELLLQLINSEGLGEVEGLLETFRYMQAIEWISKTIKRNSVILPKTILNIHSRCLYGPLQCGEKAVFRTGQHITQVKDAKLGYYRAPDPDEILALIEDYCDFINKDILSPAAQAGISHFQIESIHPFEASLDATERALSHMIFFRRGLLRSTIAPLALGPARSTEAHARYLLPYHFGYPVGDVNSYINSGAIFTLCAYYTELAARSINCFLDTVSNLESYWRQQAGKVEKGSTVDIMLRELPGMPVVTVKTVMDLVGRSFSASNDALKKLQKVGILKPMTPIQKSQAFVAYKAVHAFEKIDQKLFIKDPIALDDLIIE